MGIPHTLQLDRSEHNRPTEARIRVKIPKKYHYEPIISRLASQHHLEINIISAMLGANAEGDGWFDLLLIGSSQQIDSALIYLSDLDIEVLHKSGTEPDGW